MPRQLPLDISPAAEPSFDSFIAGANAEALERVRALAAGNLHESIVYLWGEPGSGRSHLLRAAARAHSGLVVADDVESLDAAAQQALFVAINGAREGQAAVLAAGSAPPAGLALREDLRTRLGWGLVYHLKPLTDAEKAVHLRAEALRRGLRLTDEVVWYLLHRLPRDVASLNAALELLDRHSLARQRPITLPLIREALSEENDG
ncbi:MAG TPA: DnaA/Hda family protein [Burkholderiales bacterium]